MNRLALLWLALGLVLGLLMGSLAQETPPLVNTQRRTTPNGPPAVSARPHPRDATPEGAAATASSKVHGPDARESPRARNPTEATEALPGMGRLWIDFRDSKVGFVEVTGRNIKGDAESARCDAEESREGLIDLVADEYVVAWKVSEGRNAHVVAIRIEAGGVTRLRIADAWMARRSPIPLGLGRLDVTVASLRGGPLARAPVEVSGFAMRGEQIVSELTDGEGRCRFHLRPGEYRVRIGDRIEHAVVEKERTTPVAIQYQGEGELVFLPRSIGTVSLRPLRVPRGASQKPAMSHIGSRARMLYVAAGRYEVLFEARPGQGWRRLGEVEVAAGAQSEFHYQRPKGGIHVTACFEEGVFYPLARIQLKGLDGQSPLRDGVSVRPNWKAVTRLGASKPVLQGRAWFPYLEPGRYEVRAIARGCHPITREISVGGGVVTIEILFSEDSALGGRWPPDK